MLRKAFARLRETAERCKNEIIKLHHKLALSPRFKTVYAASYLRVLYILLSTVTLSILAVTWFLKLSAVITIALMIQLDIPSFLLYFHISFFLAVISGLLFGFISGLLYPIVTGNYRFTTLTALTCTFCAIYLIDDYLAALFEIKYPLLPFLQAALATAIMMFIILCAFVADGRWLEPSSMMYSTDTSYKRLKAFAQKVIHIKAEGHYVRMMTDDSEKFIRRPFSKVISLMDKQYGMKVHRSHWVRYDAVDKVQKKDRKFLAQLRNGVFVPVSADNVICLKNHLDTDSFE